MGLGSPMDPVSARSQNCPLPPLWISACPVLPGNSIEMLLRSWQCLASQWPQHTGSSPVMLHQVLQILLPALFARGLHCQHTWKALCLSTCSFSCLQTALSLSLFKLPQSLPPQSPLTCLIGCGGGFLANVLVHALSEHMLVLLDPRDHPKGGPSQQAEDGM